MGNKKKKIVAVSGGFDPYFSCDKIKMCKAENVKNVGESFAPISGIKFIVVLKRVEGDVHG